MKKKGRKKDRLASKTDHVHIRRRKLLSLLKCLLIRVLKYIGFLCIQWRNGTFLHLIYIFSTLTILPRALLLLLYLFFFTFNLITITKQGNK